MLHKNNKINLHFRHFRQIFDEKMHYFINHQYLDPNKEVNCSDAKRHDPVHCLNVQAKRGRWNFIENGQNFSCSVYAAIEQIHRNLQWAHHLKKPFIDIAWVPRAYSAAIPRKIFYKIFKPVLEQLLTSLDCHLTPLLLKGIEAMRIQ